MALRAALVMLAVLICGLSPSHAYDASIVGIYARYSISFPNPSLVVVCHGFGCEFRTAVDLSERDRAKLTALLNAGRASAEAERRAVAAATSWFDRHVGPVAGTTNRVAYAGLTTDRNAGQMDCIDVSVNNTSFLVVLDQMHLLRHHTVEGPVSRGMLIFDNRWPHATAVLRETRSGRKWAVDNWTHEFGGGPDVKPLEEWMDEGWPPMPDWLRKLTR